MTPPGVRTAEPAVAGHRHRRWARLVAVILAAVLLTSVTATPAFAKPPVPDPGETQQQGACVTSVKGDLGAETLPVNRWSSATEQFHSRLDADSWNDVPEKLQRNAVMSTGMSVGNAAWSTTARFVEFAVSFCILDKVGGVVDQTAATLGKAILNSPILVALVVILLGFSLWRSRRGGGNPSRLVLQKVLVVGLLAIMVAGASGSTGGGINGSKGAFRPGKFSPGWFATTTDKTIASLAAAPVTALGMVDLPGAEQAGGGQVGGGQDPVADPDNPLSCARYVAALKDYYRSRYGMTLVSNSAASTPMIMSSMWETSGLQAWVQAQFGKQNLHGPYMYCRLLEQNAGIPFAEQDLTVPTFSDLQGSLMAEVDPRLGHGNKSVLNPAALAWRAPSDNIEADRQIVGWAVCRLKANKVTNIDKPDGFEAIHGTQEMVPDGTDAAAACYRFFNQSGWEGKEFNWPDDKGKIQKDTGGDQPGEDFLLTMHGNKNAVGIISVVVYLATGAAMFCVFGLIAVGIMVAKAAAVVMMFFAFVMIIATLLPNADVGRIGGYAKQYAGLSLFAFGAQLILAAIAFTSKMLISAGQSVMPGGPSGLMSMLWSGMAPLLSVFILHLMFKKMRLPSPFKLSSGLAWAGAAGAVGGSAAAIGIDRWASRGRDAAKGLVSRGGKAAYDRTVSSKRKGAQTRTERTNRMEPHDPEQTGATTTSSTTTTTTGTANAQPVKGPAAGVRPAGVRAGEATTTLEKEKHVPRDATPVGGEKEGGAASADRKSTPKEGQPEQPQPTHAQPEEAEPERAASTMALSRAEQRHIDAEKAREEAFDRKQSRSWARSQKAGAGQRFQNAAGGIPGKVRDSSRLAAEEFKNKPFSSIGSGAKTLGKGALLAGGGAALLTAGWAPLGAGAGAYLGGRALRRRFGSEGRELRSQRRQAQVDEYRLSRDAAREQVRSSRSAMESELAGAARNSVVHAKSMDSHGDEGMSDAASPVREEQARADASRTANGVAVDPVTGETLTLQSADLVGATRSRQDRSGSPRPPGPEPRAHHDG